MVMFRHRRALCNRKESSSYSVKENRGRRTGSGRRLLGDMNAHDGVDEEILLG